MNEMQKISEEELEHAVGGNNNEPKNTSWCHFTWNGGKQEKRGDETWIQCNSRASSCTFCSCHLSYACKDRWHRVYNDDVPGIELELYPRGSTNHKYKSRANNYNT